MVKRTIGQVMGHPFYGGVSSSALAPFSFPISLGDFPLQLDYKYADRFLFEPLQGIREQADQRDTPGEHSINRRGMWRRSGDSFHLGAGQDHYDRDTSSPFRFRASTGMDIWEKWHLTQLKDTDQKLGSANTNLFMAIAGSDFYTLDGATLKRSTNMNVDTPTLTALTGTAPANNGTSIASDGFNVWTAHGSVGIWKTTRGSLAWAGAAHITGTATLVAYVRGRVLAANNGSVWDITVAAQGGGGVALGGAGAPLLFTHPNTDFKWKGFAEGRNAIYMIGYSGDKTQIFRTVIKSDGTGLDAPIVAGELPDGELGEAIYGYLGPFLYIGIGGEPGWRFAAINASGDLNIGRRVETPEPVLCFEGQQDFVWWGYSGYSGSQTGLGRLSTAEFGDVEHLVPAYASDLMVDGQTAEVQSVVTFQDIRIFSVRGIGIYAEHHLGNLVPVATMDTGEITFNMNQDKIGMFVDVIAHSDLEATHGFYVSIDGGAFAFIGEHHEHLTSFSIGAIKARTFELRLELKRDSVDLTAGQDFMSWLFRAIPVPSVTRFFTIPFLVTDEIEDDDGVYHPQDPWEVFDYVEQVQKNKEIIQLTIGPRGYPVVIDTYRWRIHKLTDPLQGFGFNATLFANIELISQEIG
jgi:hypothetical protein